MADIKDMSREEIEKYLASMPKDTTEPSAEQETIAENTMRGADGSYDVSKVNLSKMFSDKANERKSHNKGSKWQAYIDKNITDPAAKADMEQQIQAIVSANPNMSPKELKFRLRAVEANLRRKYPNGVSKNFDISGRMLDSTMAKDLLALGLKGDNKPAETKQPDTATPPAAETPKETKTTVVQKPAIEQKGPTTNDELSAAFKRIKNKQASDADLALFSKYSEEQLKKMGFGPISIAAIKGKKQGISTRIGPAGGNGLGQNSVKPGEMEAANQRVADAKANALKLSDEDQAFMDKYRSYTQQLSGAQPRSDSTLKAIQSSDAYKFVNDPANKKRYSQLLKTEAENKKTNKTNISAAKAERNNVGMAKAMDQYYAHH